MQSRLTRSPSDKMIAGVCGGLGEYFGIDPVLVRLIFVIVALTSGLSIPVYVVLWLITPLATRAPGSGASVTQSPGQADQQVPQPAARTPVSARSGEPGQAPDGPRRYRYDPFTGQPLSDEAVTGATVNLRTDAERQLQYTAIEPPRPDARRRGSPRTLGIVLLIVGAVALLAQLGIPMGFAMPALLVAIGVVLLLRSR